MMRKHAQAGFTLLEVGIAAAVMGTIIAITMLILTQTQHYAKGEIALTHFHFRAQKYTETVMTPLFDGNIRRVYDVGGGSSGMIAFPLPTGNRLEAIEYARLADPPMDANGDIQWTANSFYLRFEPLPAPRNQISEAAIDLDLNLDGDRLDRFDQGVLQRAEGNENDYTGPLEWENVWEDNLTLTLLYEQAGVDMFTVEGDATTQTAKQVNIDFLFYDAVNRLTIRITDSVAMRNAQ